MATAKVLNGQQNVVAFQDHHDCHHPHCRFCYSPSLRIDWAQGDRVCTNCGVVDEEHLLDDRPEWREFHEADDLAKGGSSLARSGLVVVDESQYLGGLQPTTLSRHVYGGSSSSSSCGRSASSSSQIRKRLLAASRRIDHRMSKLSAQSMEVVRLHRKIQKRRRDNEIDEEDDDLDLRPEYEQLVLQEEEDAHRVQAALYTDKWSLQRAIQLFGTDHEVSLLEGNKDASLVENGERLDTTLKQASKDLYRAYSMLLQSASQLHLPDRVKGEAVSLLCRYAARRDGLIVRGVSSMLKRKEGVTVASPIQERMARAALGDYNKMKQAGALCSALIFYSCRFMGWPRPLEEVCASVRPLNTDNPNLKVDKNQFIKKKHCSRAMNEVKELFPDLAHGTSTPSLNGQVGTIISSSCKNTTHLANFVDHKLRSLHLPPVAEAVVRSLVCYWQQKSNSDTEESSNLSALCAALTLFVCHTGAVMQRLASHASSKSKKRRVSEQTKTTSTSIEPFDVFDTIKADDLSAEQRAYEMGRVWDAWCEQTPWSRSLAEVEQSCRVSGSSILEFYRKKVYPERGRLLSQLKDSVGEGEVDDVFVSLKGTPLSSVLLPQIHVASSLLNEEATLK